VPSNHAGSAGPDSWAPGVSLLRGGNFAASFGRKPYGAAKLLSLSRDPGRARQGLAYAVRLG